MNWGSGDRYGDVNDHKDLRTGRLRLGVCPPGYQRYISRPLGDLAGNHPGLRLELTTGTTDDLVPRLATGEIDGIIGHRGWLKRWPDLRLMPLASFHSAFMVRREHPLAGKAGVTEREILSLPMIIPATVEPLQTDLATLYTRNELPPLNPHYVVDDVEVIQNIVDSTDACAPMISLNPDFGRMRQRHHLFMDEVDMPVQRMVFATSQTRMLSPGAAALASILQENFGCHSLRE